MRKTEQNFISDVIRRILLAWLSAAALFYWLLPENLRSLEGADGLLEMSFPSFLLTAILLFCGLCLLSRRLDTRKAERFGILAVFGVLSLLSLLADFSLPFFCAILLVFVILGVYAVLGASQTSISEVPQSSSPRPPRLRNKKPADSVQRRRAAIWFVAAFSLLFFGFVSVWTVFRVLTYSAPSFDFGIFSQMFYQMKKTGLPNTTLERDGLLSHFQVHVSPIYYLLLPVYWLFPFPVTLQILQAAILASCALPAWKLAQKHGCSPFACAFFCLLLLLYPAYSGGAAYDLHENAFLTPLLLWLFYAIDCQRRKHIAIFTVLTLLVKEDAAVYVAILGLWLSLRSALNREENRIREILTGGLLFVCAAAWFLLATGYLSSFGDGVMTSRYQNFMYDGSASLITVIKAVILSPMKALYECVDSEKLAFLGLTMLPLCGMPLITRRYERFLLLVPYVLVNLMSDYKYQHDIFFQYTFGSAACLFYLTLVNYAELASKIRRRFLKSMPLLLAVTVSAACFGSAVVPKALRYPARFLKQREQIKSIDRFLKLIPADASVTATSFYAVALANRDVLYDLRYSSRKHLLSTEYIVLGIKDKSSYVSYDSEEKDGSGFTNLIRLLDAHGYQRIASLEGTLAIYRKMP